MSTPTSSMFSRSTPALGRTFTAEDEMPRRAARRRDQRRALAANASADGRTPIGQTRASRRRDRTRSSASCRRASITRTRRRSGFRRTGLCRTIRWLSPASGSVGAAQPRILLRARATQARRHAEGRRGRHGRGRRRHRARLSERPIRTSARRSSGCATICSTATSGRRRCCSSPPSACCS